MSQGTPERDDSSRRRLEHRLALIAILFSATLLRLVFAWPQADGGRFWDERYGFRNVAAVLVEGRAAPAHAFYPSLSFLPHTVVLAASDGLYRLTGVPALAIVQDPDGKLFSATAYRLSRSVSIFFGVLSLWLLYRLGCRILDPASALVGALLLATFWRHVRASVEFKPDALVVALTLLAVLWSLRAARRATPGAFLLAGVAIGLATAAKYNAAVVAVVLVVALIARGREGIRRWWGLAVAGLASVAVFVLLNPWLSMVLRDFRWQLGYYAGEAAKQGSDHGQVLVSELGFFARHHGPVVTLFVVLGLAGWFRLAAKCPSRRPELLAVLAFTIGYPLLYAAITPLFLSQNQLPVVPFTCLAAGWAMVAGWRWLASRWTPLRRPVWRGAAFLALFVLAYRFPVMAVCEETVPTTADQTAALLPLHLTPVELRTAYYERREAPLHALQGRYRLPLTPVAALLEVPALALDLADCEIFPADRLVGEGSDAYLRRLIRPQVTRIERVAPRPFAARGPELVTLFHPWRQLEPASVLAWSPKADGNLRSHLPDWPAGEVLSVSLTVPRRLGQPRLTRLGNAAEPVALFQTNAVSGGAARFTSARWVAVEGPRELVLTLKKPPEDPSEVKLELHRWAAGGGSLERP